MWDTKPEPTSTDPCDLCARGPRDDDCRECHTDPTHPEWTPDAWTCDGCGRIRPCETPEVEDAATGRTYCRECVRDTFKAILQHRLRVSPCGENYIAAYFTPARQGVSATLPNIVRAVRAVVPKEGTDGNAKS